MKQFLELCEKVKGSKHNMICLLSHHLLEFGEFLILSLNILFLVLGQML